MRTKLLIAVAATAFSAVLAGNSALAQDEILPKHKQPEQGEAPAMRQEPANQMEAPKTKSDRSGKPLGSELPAKNPAAQTEEPAKNPAVQTGEPAKQPADNAERTTPAERKQSGRTKCPAGQEGDCAPSKARRTGEEQPENGIKPKSDFEQQPAKQVQPREKPRTGESAQQPESPVTKPDQTQTGQSQTGERSDSDVVGSINVPREKINKVRETLLRSGTRSETEVNINVDVGQALPERVRPRRLPPEIVEIVPEYRSYDYVVVRDEIVIVEPRTRKVVEIIRKGSGASHARASSRIKLTAEQRRMILDYARQRRTARAQSSFDAETGMSVPSSIELAPMPDTIVTEVPAVRSYDFFVDQNDEVVLVDPDSRSVIEVIQ